MELMTAEGRELWMKVYLAALADLAAARSWEAADHVVEKLRVRVLLKR
jgi:hypothetical protein